MRAKNQLEQFQTIATFTLPVDLVTAKSLLDSNGIPFVVLDEFTVQAHNFLSNALGGIKLQVQAKDAGRAVEILTAAGIVKEEITLDINASIAQKYQKFFKFSVIIVVSITVAVFIYVILSRPSQYEKLIGKKWCLHQVVYGEYAYLPSTTQNSDVKIGILFDCRERIIFYTDSVIRIPGFNTSEIMGKWIMEKNKVRIHVDEQLDFKLDGVYDIDLSGDLLIFRSDETEIICYESKY